MSTEPANTSKPVEKQNVQLYGMKWYFFAIFTLVILAATYLGKLPKGMIGAFPLMIIIGTIFGKIGDNTPIIKTFLGGGAIVIIFGLAALFDRTIRGFTLSAYRETVHTTIPAVNMAFKNRRAQEGLLFHSDRGGGTVRNLFQRGCGNGVLRSDSA